MKFEGQVGRKRLIKIKLLNDLVIGFCTGQIVYLRDLKQVLLVYISISQFPSCATTQHHITSLQSDEESLVYTLPGWVAESRLGVRTQVLVLVVNVELL